MDLLDYSDFGEQGSLLGDLGDGEVSRTPLSLSYRVHIAVDPCHAVTTLSTL